MRDKILQTMQWSFAIVGLILTQFHHPWDVVAWFCFGAALIIAKIWR